MWENGGFAAPVEHSPCSVDAASSRSASVHDVDNASTGDANSGSTEDASPAAANGKCVARAATAAAALTASRGFKLCSSGPRSSSTPTRRGRIARQHAATVMVSLRWQMTHNQRRRAVRPPEASTTEMASTRRAGTCHTPCSGMPYLGFSSMTAI